MKTVFLIVFLVGILLISGCDTVSDRFIGTEKKTNAYVDLDITPQDNVNWNRVLTDKYDIRFGYNKTFVDVEFIENSEGHNRLGHYYCQKDGTTLKEIENLKPEISKTEEEIYTISFNITDHEFENSYSIGYKGNLEDFNYNVICNNTIGYYLSVQEYWYGESSVNVRTDGYDNPLVFKKKYISFENVGYGSNIPTVNFVCKRTKEEQIVIGNECYQTTLVNGGIDNTAYTTCSKQKFIPVDTEICPYDCENCKPIRKGDKIVRWSCG